MDTLETNVAKIQIGNSKQTNTYVTTIAERTPHEDCELFAIVALPLLNPAAADDCERIATGIIATLRRAYKRSNNESTFEVALGEINDEIGKLASLGQSNWTGKISAVIAARQGKTFSAAATGKTSAILMRGGDLNEITEVNHPKHPLKTFEAFSAGRIKVGDVIIITTAELFNHVSIDRVKNILSQNTLEIAAQELVRIIEDTAGPEVAFATLLLQETEPMTQLTGEQLNLNDYSSTKTSSKLLATAGSKLKGALNKESAQKLWGTIKATAQNRTGTLNVKNLSGKALSQGSAGLQRIREQAKQYRHVDFRSPYVAFKNFSRPKQFFTVCVCVLAIAVVINVFVARSRRHTANTMAAFTTQTVGIQKLLSDAESKLVFKDELGAGTLAQTAKTQLESLETVNETQAQQKQSLLKQTEEIIRQANKIETPSVSQVATLSSAEHLLLLNNQLATVTNKVVVSYNIGTSLTKDGEIKTQTEVVDATAISADLAVAFDGQGLNVWDTSKGTNTTPFFQNVPKPGDFTSLVFYPTNSRVYTVDRGTNQVMSYAATSSGLSKPTVSVKDAKLADAQDLAIDGSIYILTKTDVKKFTAGKVATFLFPALPEAFSGTGKIYTDSKATKVYILDADGKIIITEKTGKLVRILQSDELKGANDFVVDEAGKVIFVLRNGSLLKLGL
ncbi:MAG: hypothetical protein KBD66_00660 [Candidatus Doudnabacteria bacterium]|nr:hypothetical protein [Candidatus Doudnabacteria bacterium]